MHEEVVYPAHEVVTIQLDDGIIPKPFNVNDYLSHIKRHRQTRSSHNNGNRYALFILDGSSSIGLQNFETMKSFVVNLTFVFQHCGFTAVMTYNQCAYLQYGFTNFHEISNSEFLRLRNCINAIEYPGGVTASGNAIRMAYEEVLNKTVNDATEIDIIFMTDGRSNTGENPCTEAVDYWNKLRENVHKQRGKVVHVYPIGIGNNINHEELHCIMGEHPDVDQPLHVLNFTMLNDINDHLMLKVATTHQTSKFCTRFHNYQEMICSFVGT